MEKSIYRQICDHITDGILAPDFCINEDDYQEGAFRFAPGALDGITYYHMGFGELNADAAKEMIRALKSAAQGSWNDADDKFAVFCKEHRAICLVDQLQNYLRKHQRQLAPNEMHGAAVHFLLHSKHVECVKIGLEILELFGEPVDELKEIIRRIGQYDEFTLFAVWNMLKWKNGNDEIFKLAKLTHSWGRIHAVEHLEAETEEIRRWLLTEGTANEVTNAYSALTCWTKSGADKLLQGKITREEYRGIAAIMEGLLDEGPVPGISRIGNREQVLLRFLDQTKTHAAEEGDFEIIPQIFAWTEDKEEDYTAVRSACDALLQSEKCIQAVKRAVEKGEGLRLADLLEIPFRDQLYRCMCEDFEHFFYKCSYLMEDPSYADRTVDLFRQKLPLAEMTGDPTDVLGMDSGYTDYNALEFILQELSDKPLTGCDLMLTGIRSPYIRLRNRALTVLQNWVEDTKEPLSQLSPELFEAVKDLESTEPADGPRKMIAPLLDGEIHFHGPDDYDESEEEQDEK